MTHRPRQTVSGTLIVPPARRATGRTVAAHSQEGMTETPPVLRYPGRAVGHRRGSTARMAGMKFLCLDCDEPMKLYSTEGPDQGSLAVTFRCPTCGFRVAMLTN